MADVENCKQFSSCYISNIVPLGYKNSSIASPDTSTNVSAYLLKFNMPNFSTITSKPYVLTLQGTENIIVEDFLNLHYVIQTAPEEGLHPERIFLLFTSKRDEQTGEAIDPLCNQAEKTVIDYLSCISETEKQDAKFVHCRIKEEELHLLSLNKIFPWCILENIEYLPALMSLDGMRILYKNDLCNFMKLDLIFSQRKKIKKCPMEYSPNIEPKPRSLVLNLRRDGCSLHGKVIRSDFMANYISESEEEEEEEENRAVYKNDKLGRIHFVQKRAFQVQRRPLVEPVIEPPPAPPRPKGKPKKKGKGKGGKGKGKGKKGKGKKGKK